MFVMMLGQFCCALRSKTGVCTATSSLVTVSRLQYTALGREATSVDTHTLARLTWNYRLIILKQYPARISFLRPVSFNFAILKNTTLFPTVQCSTILRSFELSRSDRETVERVLYFDHQYNGSPIRFLLSAFSWPNLAKTRTTHFIECNLLMLEVMSQIINWKT